MAHVQSAMLMPQDKEKEKVSSMQVDEPVTSEKPSSSTPCSKKPASANSESRRKKTVGSSKFNRESDAVALRRVPVTVNKCCCTII